MRHSPDCAHERQPAAVRTECRLRADRHDRVRCHQDGGLRDGTALERDSGTVAPTRLEPRRVPVAFLSSADRERIRFRHPDARRGARRDGDHVNARGNRLDGDRIGVPRGSFEAKRRVSVVLDAHVVAATDHLRTCLVAIAIGQRDFENRLPRATQLRLEHSGAGSEVERICLARKSKDRPRRSKCRQKPGSQTVDLNDRLVGQIPNAGDRWKRHRIDWEKWQKSPKYRAELAT